MRSTSQNFFAGLFQLRVAYGIDTKVGVGVGGDVGEGEGRAFPQQARRALADGVETFYVQGVAAGAQADGALIVAHRVAGRAANLGERWAGFRHLHAVDDKSRAVTVDIR